MWDGIRPALEQNWKMYTYEDGRLIEEALTHTFNNTHDLTTR